MLPFSVPKARRGMKRGPSLLRGSSTGGGGGLDGGGDESDGGDAGGEPWLPPSKRGAMLMLEDAAAKAARLARGGCLLAEEGHFRRAAGAFGEALQYTPHNAAVLEMKAQVCGRRPLCFCEL